MKKKISLLIGIFILALSFTGCASNGGATSNKEVATKEEVASLEQISDTIIGSFSQMADKDFAQFTEGSELEVNLTLMQTGLPVTRDSFVGMIHSWNAAKKDCGTYQSHGAYDVKISAKDITLVTDAEFEDRKATITVVFDEKMNMDSMTVDAKYSTIEILKKAGLNTVLGMGTVFAVLIFIALIISLFAYIPKIQAKFQKKNEILKTTQTVSADAAVSCEDAIDDTEVIAVITAAIAASLETTSDGFVVRSIKRRSSNKWS